MPPGLFNQSSPEQKVKIFDFTSKEGMVFLAESPVAKKQKFFVIVGESNNKVSLAYFFINSRINPNIATNCELELLHMPILKTDHDFLSHDSYIDCSQLYEIETEKVKRFFCQDMNGKYICVLPKEVVENLKYMIEESPTITPKQKRKFGYL